MPATAGIQQTQSAPLFLPQRVALLDQLLKLFGLFRDAVGVSLLILGARGPGGLLDQLPDIVANNGDAIVEFGARKRSAVAHDVFSTSNSQDRLVSYEHHQKMAFRN